MAVAGVLKLTVAAAMQHPLMLELPSYRWPHARNLLLGSGRTRPIFIMRVGNIILALMVVLWFLSSFPAPPEGATGPAIQYSYAGMLGQALEVIFAPIGFNWQISIALVPGMAAREVAVGALGTVYALSATGDDVATQLAPMLAAGWSLPTAFSLLAWYVFSPQCLSTLAVVKRETNSWRYPLLMAGYLFALAYGAAFVTYRIALFLTGGGPCLKNGSSMVWSFALPSTRRGDCCPALCGTRLPNAARTWRSVSDWRLPTPDHRSARGPVAGRAAAAALAPDAPRGTRQAM
jgi:ferrous iron transport protein B